MSGDNDLRRFVVNLLPSSLIGVKAAIGLLEYAFPCETLDALFARIINAGVVSVSETYDRRAEIVGAEVFAGDDSGHSADNA